MLPRIQTLSIAEVSAGQNQFAQFEIREHKQKCRKTVSISARSAIIVCGTTSRNPGKECETKDRRKSGMMKVDNIPSQPLPFRNATVPCRMLICRHHVSVGLFCNTKIENRIWVSDPKDANRKLTSRMKVIPRPKIYLSQESLPGKLSQPELHC